MKRAPVFPSSESLQPIPQNAHPNISGNVNSTTKYVPKVVSVPTNELTFEENEKINPETTKTNNNQGFPWVMLSVFILIVLIIVAVYRKIKK